MPKIRLFQFEECPYCAKVRSKLEELNLEYEKVEVAKDREDPQRKEIAEKSGVLSVPVIDIDGAYTGESDDIVKKLEAMKA